MKIESIIKDGKIIGVDSGDGKTYDIDINKIKSIKYKYMRILWGWGFRITTKKEEEIWGPFIFFWNYKKIASEIKKINPNVEDIGIDYSIIGLMFIIFVLGFFFSGLMRIIGFI